VTKEEQIVELGQDINDDSHNYNYPNAPGTLFLAILARYARVEDSAGIVDSIGLPMGEVGVYGDLEIEHLKEWLSEMWDLCDYDEDFQLLYDTIVGVEEEEEEDED